MGGHHFGPLLPTGLSLDKAAGSLHAMLRIVDILEPKV